MNKYPIFILISFLFTFHISAQEESTTKETDSIQKDLKKNGIVMEDSLFTKRKEINPLAPSKAAFFSAVLPGLGQIYNKRYWKVPIVYAVLGSAIYGYKFNNDRYKLFRTAFKREKAGFDANEVFAPQTPNFSTEALQNGQERYQRDRDLMLVLTIVAYALNVVDANVDAHLKQFNIDDNLSMDMDLKPYLDYNEITASPSYGMALTIKF